MVGVPSRLLVSFSVLVSFEFACRYEAELDCIGGLIDSMLLLLSIFDEMVLRHCFLCACSRIRLSSSSSGAQYTGNSLNGFPTLPECTVH